jgi:hypothetical protein
MPTWPDGRLRLREYVAALRSELSGARAEADGDNFQFDMDSATLEVDIAYSFERAGKPQFWVLAPPEDEADDGPEPVARDRQRLVLRLGLRADATPDDETPVSDPATLPPPAPWRER